MHIGVSSCNNGKNQMQIYPEFTWNFQNVAFLPFSLYHPPRTACACAHNTLKYEEEKKKKKKITSGRGPRWVCNPALDDQII